MTRDTESDNKNEYSLKALAELLGAELVLRNGVSDATDILIGGIAPLTSAVESQLSFCASSKHHADLIATSATAVIVAADSVDDCPVHCLVHVNPYLAFAQLSHAFDLRPKPALGIHPSAVIASTASIAEGAHIAPGVVVMDYATIGRNVCIGPNSVIEASAFIGDNVTLMANTNIGFAVKLGDDVRVDSGTVIGSDGFGYAPSPQVDAGHRWHKIAQLGSVVIGDRVEIGANTVIDRGALDNTVIEEDVIIDNQVHLAHNVFVGRGTAIAGCVGVAGSTSIGQYCTIAGGVCVTGHITIADKVTVLGMSKVTGSIKESGTYSSGTGIQEISGWRKSAVRFTQLDTLHQRVKTLEKQQKD
ncbi:MAG: UDP-3-O-(3-hydroxymyristoyl)glucosamine N-acyltransferase [Cellvibrionales bacterium]|jgi:UDP-3-O-[3-hydroxymyristoyl] glucosamine N-acyltransferase|nr:UDP-3-O-(3-hydroxymyristoyl)glucosamine N-acyltransferase [Cellvibrionales bacterium]